MRIDRRTGSAVSAMLAWKSVPTLSIAFAAWLALEGILHPAGSAARSIGATTLIAIATLLRAPSISMRRLLWVIPAIGIVIATPAGPAASAALCLAVSMIGHSEHRRLAARLLALSVAAAFLVPTLVSTVMDSLSAIAPSMPSPAATGIESVLYAGVICLTYCRVISGRWIALLLSGAMALGIAAMLISEQLVETGGWSLSPMNSPAVACNVVCGLLASILVGIAASHESRNPVGMNTAVRTAVVTAAAAGVFVVALAMVGFRLGNRPDRSVAFLNVGGFDWKVPTYGAYGAFSGGMFGMLPEYLGAAGWSCSVLPLESVSRENLANAGVTVAINCPVIWNEEHRSALIEYVRDGGSLVILGDHTDVFGLQRGFNSLLEGTGIQYNFDSAYSPTTEFNTGWAYSPSSLGCALDSRWAGTGIGASLSVRFPARPVVVSKYAFSDKGVRTNTVGAFLGNYQLDDGERRGDIVLLAERSVGRGTIAVWGDTSGFQNSELPYNFTRFVEPTLSRLATPKLVVSSAAMEWSFVLLSIAALLTWAVLGAPGTRWLLVGATTLYFLVCMWSRLRHSSTEVLRRLKTESLALIDYSHYPDIGHRQAGWNASSALITCLARSGFLPIVAEKFDEEVFRRARVVAIVAPRMAYNADETEALLFTLQDRRKGLLVCVSAAHSASVQRLLESVGLAIQPTVLGPINDTVNAHESAVSFVEPSAIVDVGGGAKSLFRCGEDVIAASIGRDGLNVVAIGDSRFFSEQNVEGLWGWNAGVLEFIGQAFFNELGGQLDPRSPVFPDPPEDGQIASSGNATLLRNVEDNGLQSD